MTLATLLLFVVVIVAQARSPERRLAIVLVGAGLAMFLLGVGGGNPRAVWAALPWDVLVILGALGVVSEVFARSQLFTHLAVATTRRIQASPSALVPVAAVSMFVVSGLVNNITALMLVLPVVLSILQLAGTTARHLRWTLGTLLVACNLGGAATPIGDFPAVLLLGAGAMDFVGYLRAALPIALAALTIFLVIVVAMVRPARDVPIDDLRRKLTVAVVEGLHARIKLVRRDAVAAGLVLVVMLGLWSFAPPSLLPAWVIAWLGAGALVLVVGRDSRALIVRGVDLDATLFLFGLLVMVGAVRESGLFSTLASTLQASSWSGTTQLVVFIVAAGVATGLFSAGPSMAALLEVAPPLVAELGPAAVYVGLAFGVCAGSSLLLTAATSGPLAQSMVERAGLRDVDGQRLSLSFATFVPVGVLAFGVIVAVGVVGARLLVVG